MEIAPALKSLTWLIENHYGMKSCMTEYTKKHLEPLYGYSVCHHRPFVHVDDDTMIVFCYCDTDNMIDFDGYLDSSVERFGINGIASSYDRSPVLSHVVIFSKSEKKC